MIPIPNSSSVIVGQSKWHGEVLLRLRTLWVRKTLVTTFGCTAFMMVYFWILHNPLYPVTMMPVTAIDRAIGVAPAMLPIYLSLWVYVSLFPALLKSSKEFTLYAISAFVLSIIGLGICLFWPTAVPRFDIDWFQYPSMSFLKDNDMAGNAFPSMHVAFSMFTAILMEDILRQMNAGRTVRAINWMWCLGILYSTLATAQHVLLDVLGGIVLGAIAGLFHFALLRFSLGNTSPANSL